MADLFYMVDRELGDDLTSSFITYWHQSYGEVLSPERADQYLTSLGRFYKSMAKMLTETSGIVKE